MYSPVCRLTRLLMCAVFLANVVACSSMPPPSPALLARCELLYGLWSRYEQLPVFHHSGQKARAEWARVALYQAGLGLVLGMRHMIVAATMIIAALAVTIGVAEVLQNMATARVATASEPAVGETTRPPLRGW